jgi:hypothetical protein
MAISLTVPERLDVGDMQGIVRWTADIFAAARDRHELTVDFSRHEFCDPAGIVMLASALKHYNRTMRQPAEFIGWQKDCYLSRFHVKEHAGHKDDFPKLRRRRPRGFTELAEIVHSQHRQDACGDVNKLLQVDDAEAAKLLAYAMEEMLRNVEDHAESLTNALIHGQRFSGDNRVVVAIADTGRGILRSLREWHNDLAGDVEAIGMAMKPGVSSRNTRRQNNQGVGLTATSTMIRHVGGRFHLASGTGLLELSSHGTILDSMAGVAWSGVVVVLEVWLRQDINWAHAHTQALREVSRL